MLSVTARLVDFTRFYNVWNSHCTVLARKISTNAVWVAFVYMTYETAEEQSRSVATTAKALCLIIFASGTEVKQKSKCGLLMSVVQLHAVMYCILDQYSSPEL